MGAWSRSYTSHPTVYLRAYKFTLEVWFTCDIFPCSRRRRLLRPVAAAAATAISARAAGPLFSPVQLGAQTPSAAAPGKFGAGCEAPWFLTSNLYDSFGITPEA